MLKVRRAAEGLATTSLGAGEVALILDGGKGGNARKLFSPWHPGTTEDLDDDETEGQMVKGTVHIIKTEESARNSVDMSLAGFSNTFGGIEHACAEGAFTGVLLNLLLGSARHSAAGKTAHAFALSTRAVHTRVQCHSEVKKTPSSRPEQGARDGGAGGADVRADGGTHFAA